MITPTWRTFDITSLRKGFSHNIFLLLGLTSVYTKQRQLPPIRLVFLFSSEQSLTVFVFAIRFVSVNPDIISTTWVTAANLILSKTRYVFPLPVQFVFPAEVIPDSLEVNRFFLPPLPYLHSAKYSGYSRSFRFLP